jgi:hypothetical protein
MITRNSFLDRCASSNKFNRGAGAASHATSHAGAASHAGATSYAASHATSYAASHAASHCRCQSTCICIPRLDISIKQNMVINVVKRLNWGRIIGLSTVINNKNPTTPFISVFIDIIWNNNDYVNNIRNVLKDGHSVKVVHNNFNVWKIYQKKNNIHIHNN